MGGGGFGGGFRPPMSVEIGTASSGKIGATLTVVGNLIGEQTVDVAPKTGGRLQSINVQLGDRVRRNQVIAKIEDLEIVEQVKQARASMEVARATIRQREADLKVAEVNFERSKNLFGRQLLAKQALDDAESRYLSAQAQLDLAKAQTEQTGARMEELEINLRNTTIVSPVDGFVGRRNVDPGAWVSQNAPVVSVVDISRLRIVSNVVEKDLRMVNAGDQAVVEVDAYPGEKFNGRIARVSPVLDPSTRTATMEVEIPNVDYRLKPGMYARVALTIEEREHALLGTEGRRGGLRGAAGGVRGRCREQGTVHPREARARGRRAHGDRRRLEGRGSDRDQWRGLAARRRHAPAARAECGRAGCHRRAHPGPPARRGERRGPSRRPARTGTAAAPVAGRTPPTEDTS